MQQHAEAEEAAEGEDELDAVFRRASSTLPLAASLLEPAVLLPAAFQVSRSPRRRRAPTLTAPLPLPSPSLPGFLLPRRSKKKKRGRDEPPLSGREAKAAVENILTLMGESR